MAPPPRAMRAMALDDDEEPYFGRTTEAPSHISPSRTFSSTAASGFQDNSTSMMSSASVGSMFPSTTKSRPTLNSSTAPPQHSSTAQMPTAMPEELDQDNKDAPGGAGPGRPEAAPDGFVSLAGAVPAPPTVGVSNHTGKALRAKSLMEPEEIAQEVLPPPNPTRNLQMEIEDVRKQKRDLHRENNELRAKIAGGVNVSCPSRAMPLHANNVERSVLRGYREKVWSDVTPERQVALSAELQEAIDPVTEGTHPIQDPAFAALGPAALVANARLVQPRFNWVLDQLQRFLEASGFRVDLQVADIGEQDGVDACFRGDILHATFVFHVASLEQVYAGALLLARAPVMARRGTRWLSVEDRIVSEDACACSDICFAMAVDGHVAEVRVCSEVSVAPEIGSDKWIRRALDAEAVLMGAIENMSLEGGTETPHAAAAILALERLTEIKPVCDKHGLQAIHYAALHGNLPLLEKLVSLGADLFAEDKDGCLPIHRPMMHRHLDVISWLLDRMVICADKQKTQLSLVAKRKLVELWQWAIHAGGPEGHMNEGLPTVPWPIVRKLLDVATILGADTVSLTERGQNAADYVAEFGDPVFLETINRELAITPKAYATDESCTLGICNGFRGLLLTRPVRRIDWSGKKSMGRDRPLSDFAGYLSRNKCLEELIMRECALEVPGASALFSSLAVNRSLLRLDLMRNPGIGSEDALKVLGSSLCSNKALQELVLWACDISASGVAVLCSGLAENTSLLKLNLRENKGLGAPEAVSAIGSLLGKNDTLQELDLWECGIKADSVCWLYEGLGRNKGLKMLGLVGNRGLGQHAVIEALTNCLQMNSTLESLTMSGCSVKPGSIDDPRVVL